MRTPKDASVSILGLHPSQGMFEGQLHLNAGRMAAPIQQKSKDFDTVSAVLNLKGVATSALCTLQYRRTLKCSCCFFVG